MQSKITCIRDMVTRNEVSVQDKHLKTPAAYGGVIGGAGNHGVVPVDGQVGHLPIMTPAGPQQQGCLSAPDLRRKHCLSCKLIRTCNVSLSMPLTPHFMYLAARHK